MKSLNCVQLLVTPWTAAYQAPLSMGFSRQKYWSEVPLPSPYNVLIYVTKTDFMENNKKTVTVKYNRFWLIMCTYLHFVSTWHCWMWSWKQMHTQDFTIGSSALLSGLTVYDSFKQSHCTFIISIAAMNYQRIPDFAYFPWCQLTTPINHSGTYVSSQKPMLIYWW